MASNLSSAAMVLALVVSLIGLWHAVQPEAVYAHQCGRGAPSEELEEADAVFLGRVVSSSDITEFHVATVWKGPVQERVHLDESGPFAFRRFAVGEEYIVYAYYSEDSEDLETDDCTRTIELYGGLEDLAALGEGERPGVAAGAPASASSEVSGGCSASPGVVELAFVGAMVGLVCIGVRRRRVESG